MITFNIDEIPEEGLDFDVEEKKGCFDIDHPDCRLARDVRVQGKLDIIDEIVYLSGRVKTELSVVCSRCLESVRFPVDSKITARFFSRAGASLRDAESEMNAEDADREYYDEHQVDLTASIHDQILLAVPLVCLCKEDCGGLCSECGKNLNTGPCGCRKEPLTDPRLGILKTLKNKLK